MNDDDIWNGYRLGNSQENTPNINYMKATKKAYSQQSSKLHFTSSP